MASHRAPPPRVRRARRARTGRTDAGTPRKLRAAARAEMAPVVDEAVLEVPGKSLLLYLSSAADPGRFAIAPTLASAAERAGWSFECYYDTLRKGRHFGGGAPAAARPGWAGGSLVAGGRHADQVLRLASIYQAVALGHPDAVLWPFLERSETELLVRSNDPVELYEAAFARLGQAVPRRGLLLASSPQLVLAPYMYPAFFLGEPALGLERTAHSAAEAVLEQLGVREVD